MIAQDEWGSESFGVPPAAIAAGPVDFALPLDEIALALVALVTVGAGS
jgi:chemotaxis response regulator CheB